MADLCVKAPQYLIKSTQLWVRLCDITTNPDNPVNAVEIKSIKLFDELNDSSVIKLFHELNDTVCHLETEKRFKPPTFTYSVRCFLGCPDNPKMGKMMMQMAMLPLGPWQFCSWKFPKNQGLLCLIKEASP